MVFSFSIRSTHHHIPSKLVIRSTTLAAAVVVSLCSILFFTRYFPGRSVSTKLERFLPSKIVQTEVKPNSNNSPRRLIVFGDSWSDNGQYPIDPPPREQIPIRDEAQGRVWTEWLCSSVGLSESSCWLTAERRSDLVYSS